MRESVKQLESRARELRKIALEMAYVSGTEGAHIGPAFSLMDIFLSSRPTASISRTRTSQAIPAAREFTASSILPVRWGTACRWHAAWPRERN